MLTDLLITAAVLFTAAIIFVLALCRSAAIGDRTHPPEPPEDPLLAAVNALGDEADGLWPADNVREFPRRDHLGGAA
jgi:hypothetical protein